MLLDTVQNKIIIHQPERDGIVGIRSSGFLCPVLPLSYLGLFTHVPQMAISEIFL
jgi:hypothetical protein